MNINIEPYIITIFVCSALMGIVFRILKRSNFISYFGSFGLIAVGIIPWVILLDFEEYTLSFYVFALFYATVPNVIASGLVHLWFKYAPERNSD